MNKKLARIQRKRVLRNKKKFIKENYMTMTDIEIAKLYGVHRTSIGNLRIKMGCHKNGKRRLIPVKNKQSSSNKDPVIVPYFNIIDSKEEVAPTPPVGLVRRFIQWIY